MVIKWLSHPSNKIFLLILFLAAFLRFYHLGDNAHFDFDQEYAANFAYQVVNVYPVQLIGQQLSVAGLFMGPWYFYSLVPFFYLTDMHPIGGFIGSVIWGLLTIIAFYFIANKIFGKPAGLIAAFINAILFTQIDVDWYMVPSFHSGLVVLLVWWGMYNYWQGKTNSLILLGFLAGLFTSLHPIQFPFYLVLLLLLILKRKIPSLKIIGVSVIAFILPLTPLLLFEYLHNFLEIKVLIDLFSGQGPQQGKSLESILKSISFNFSNISYLLSVFFIPKTYFAALFWGTFLILFMKKVGFWRQSFHRIFFPLTIVVFLSYYFFYPTHVPEYYFRALEILSLLYLAGVLALLWQKNTRLLLFFILGILCFVNLQLLAKQNWTNTSLTGLNAKDAVVKEILRQQPADQEFYVSYIANPGWKVGYNYLFMLYGHMPQTEGARKPIYTIITPASLAEGQLKYGNIGLIVEK